MKVTATVQISMQRNLNKPIFKVMDDPEPISEHTPVGTNVTIVTATDADPPVSSCHFIL